MCTDYISLNRTFLEFNEEQDIEAAALRSYMAERYGDGPLNWDRLLESQYVVILGEPGSGKTYEMKGQVRQLQENKQYAFCVHLEDLESMSLNASIKQEEKESFLTWENSKAVAYFFLDALDEAKLQSTLYPFEKALENFIKGTGLSARHRANVVISCRVSEWNHRSDLNTLCTKFDILADACSLKNTHEKDKVPLLRIVTLASLTSKQIELLAKHYGVTDTEAFLAAIAKNYLWELVGRPLDVKYFSAYWCEHKEFNTLKQLLKFYTQETLKEPNSSRTDLLSEEKARQGAEYLAAAALFCKRLSFALPGADIQTQANSITPENVLPKDWTRQKIYAVFNRPLFDGEIYGRVRFHHRESIEYLAASWLQNLVTQHNLTYPDLVFLLFAEKHGQTVVAPSRAPLVAWFAVMGDERANQRVRKKLLQSQPEILFQYGDPQSLSTDDKKKLFAALVEKYKGRKQTWVDANNRGLLSRLASPEMADKICGYILDNTLSNDIRELFLNIVRYGRLVESVDTILGIFDNQTESEHVKLYAAIVIRDVGTLKHKQRLAEITTTYSNFSSLLCAAFCGALYPDAINGDELIALLEKSDEVNIEKTIDLPNYLEELFKQPLPDDHLEQLLSGFTRLISQPPRVKWNNEEIYLSAKYYWLGEILCRVVKQLLQRPVLDKTLIGPLVKALRALNAYRNIPPSWKYHREKCSIIKEFQNHPKLRRAYIWKTIRLLDEKQRDPFHIWKVTGTFHISDLEWLLDDVKIASTFEKRTIALELAITLWGTDKHSRKYAKRFKQAIAGQKELQQLFHQRVENYLLRTGLGSFHDVRLKLGEIHRSLMERRLYLHNYFWYLQHLEELRTGTA